MPGEASGGARGHGPFHAVDRGKLHVIRGSDGDYQDETAGVADHRQEERVETLRGVSAKEVADAPAGHGSESVGGRGEVCGEGHERYRG
jgi:hypothetical protein